MKKKVLGNASKTKSAFHFDSSGKKFFFADRTATIIDKIGSRPRTAIRDSTL